MAIKLPNGQPLPAPAKPGQPGPPPVSPPDIVLQFLLPSFIPAPSLKQLALLGSGLASALNIASTDVQSLTLPGAGGATEVRIGLWMWAASDELQTLQKWAPAKGGPLAFTLTIGMDFINQQAANAFAPTANIFLSVGTVFLDDLSVFSTPPNVLTTQFDAHFIPNFLGTLGEIDGSVSIVDTLSISRALVSSSEDVTISSDVGSYVSKDDLHGHGAGAVLANQFPQKVSLTPSFAIALFYTAASVTNTQVIFNGTFIPSSS